MPITKVSTGLISSEVASTNLNIDDNTLFIDVSTNRVGVGNLVPSTALDVTGTVTADGLTVSDTTGTVASFTSSGTTTAMNLNNTHTNGWGSNIAFQTGGTPAGYFGSIGSLLGNTDQDLAAYSTTGNGFRVYTNGNNERLRVTSAGNVGIDNNNPAYKLSIGGSFQSVNTDLISITDTATVYRGTPDGTGFEHAKILSGRDATSFTYGSFLSFYTEGKNSGTTDTSTERMRIDPSGNVGIGVTPATKFDVMTTGVNQWYIRNTDGTAQDNSITSLRSGGYSNIALDGEIVQFKISGSEKARIDSSGNVKFGATGDGYISGTAPNTYNSGYSQDNDSWSTWMNYNGYQDGASRYRDFIVGNGKQGRIATFDGSSGNVGIGISIPSEKLNLAQSVPSTYTAGLSTLAAPAGTNIRIENNSSVTDTFTGVLFVPTNGAEQPQISYVGSVSTGSGLGADIVFGRRESSAYYVESMRINSSGNVGIGTSIPSSALHISGDYASNKSDIQITNTNGGRSWRIGDGIGGITSNLVFWDGTAGASRMVIDASGNVGIGETDPNQKLHVVDTSNPASDGTVIIEGRRDGGANVLALRARDASAPTVGLPPIQGPVMRFQGFNGTDFSDMAYIYAESEAAFTDGDAPSSLIFGTTSDNSETPTERMRIDADGDVSIGTSNSLGVLTLKAPASDDQDIITITEDGINQSFSINGNFAGAGSTGNAITLDSFWTDDIIAFRGDGNVGIGTSSSSPTTKVNITQTANNLAAYIYASLSTGYTSTVFAAQGNQSTTNESYYLADFVNGDGSGRTFIYDSGDIDNTNGAYGSISDVKLKTDITDAGSQWDDIKAIRFRKYRMIADPEQRIQMGVIAQEIEEAGMSGLVRETKDKDVQGNALGTTTKSVKYSILYTKAVKALQEAMDRIETLEAKVAALES